MSFKSDYLNRLKESLRVDPATERDIVRECHAHLEDRYQEFRELGLSEEEADKAAAKLLGSPRLIAKQIGEVYSQGTWQQAIFAALPHMLIALLFALHWWENTAWVPVVILVVIGIVIYGWSHGKPTWLFPWLGYCLTPVIAIGTLLMYLPGGWVWLAAIAYIPLAITIILSVTKQTIKIDWLFASLMLLPVPIVLGWRLALGIEDITQWQARLYEAGQLIALTFAILALTAATFIRLRQRWAKAGALVAPEILLLIIVALADKNATSFWIWLFIILMAIVLLLGPATLEKRIRQGQAKTAKF
ncbi:MAG: hypothetical protein FJ013_01300 [Chloroflexi bacterium]|nr:hypothetical protein [Chloroflexota bacterium]